MIPFVRGLLKLDQEKEGGFLYMIMCAELCCQKRNQNTGYIQLPKQMFLCMNAVRVTVDENVLSTFQIFTKFLYFIEHFPIQNFNHYSTELIFEKRFFIIKG